MRRFVLFILSILYLGIATQANLRFHFCMGQVANWGIGASENKSCEKCGMDIEDNETNGCCKDEYKVVRLNVDQKSSQGKLYISELPFLADLSATFFRHEHLQLQNGQIISATLASPPSSENTPAYYLRFCNFRI